MYSYLSKQHGLSIKRLTFIVIFLFVGLILCIAPTSNAALPGFTRVKAPLVSLDEAREYFDQQEKLSPISESLTALRGTMTPTIGIQDLANQLSYDPDLIYEYVYNTIDYTPIFGSLKGGLGTLLDRQGNDFDQASLLIALLRTAGFTANYVYGVIRLDPAQVDNWLGTDDPDVLGWLLGSTGIPGDINVNPDMSLAYLDLEHVWVIVNIDGTDYAFDPSLKQYIETPPIDLTSAMNYNQVSFLSQALSSATVDADYVQNLNTANIASALSTYASNLVNYIRTNHPNAELEDIVGGKTIQPTTIPLRQTSLPYQQSIIATWTEIPQIYKTTLRIQHLGIDHTFDSSDIYGKRLTFFYDSSNAPVLRLDGTTVAVGTSSTPGAYHTMTLTADHPYAGGFGDQSQDFWLQVGGSYLIINGWAGTSEAIVEKHKHAFRQNVQAGNDSTSEPVLGESLALIGFTWLAESTQTDQIADQLYSTITIRHHIIGLAGQEDGPYVDLPLCLVSPISLENDSAAENSRFFNSGGHNSAFESGVIEQTQPYEAVSTVKLLDFANGQSNKIFEVNSTTELDALLVAGELQNYDTNEVNSITSYLNAGYRVLLPAEGDLTIGQWSGSTYLAISTDESGIGYIIGGGLNGGYATEPGTADGTNQSQVDINSADHPKSADPIDVFNGCSLASGNDLGVGSNSGDGDCGIGLTFTRSYNCAATLNKNSLGLGWTHNFDIALEVKSDGFKGMGTDSPVDASAAIAELYVTIDLLEGAKTKELVLIATLAQQWYMDQLIDNIIIFRKPETTRQFSELVDGTYNAAPEETSLLTEEPDNTYLLTTKYNTQYHFDSEGQLTTWIDQNGNMMNFSYSNGKLQSVMNNFGRSLTFTYSGDYIQQVTDDSGRSVSYQHDADGNLVSFTDPETYTTTYEYDLPGRLTKMYSPANPSNPYVTNVYDAQGCVISQTDPGGNTYTYEYADGWTRETDPAGNVITWQFNEYGKAIQEIGPDGQTRLMTYDHYHRLVEQTFPEGDRIEYEYDDRHNITQITYHPKSGSSEPPVSMNFTYDPIFNNVQTFTDHASRTTTFHYDGQGNVIQIDQPEIGGQVPQWSFTYTSKGQRETMTDPEGTVTRYTYDAATGDLLETVRDDGGLNMTFQMEYDNAGNLIRFTDPRGNNTLLEYDGLRQLTRIDAPLYSPIEYSYNPDGNLLTITTGVQVTTFTYTPSGHKKTITNPEGHVTTYHYDSLDQVWKIINAEDQVFEFVYDASGNLIKILDAQGYALEEYSFTLNGKPETFTNANGNTTDFTYDDFDRPTRITYPDGSYEELSYDTAWNVVQKRIRDGQFVMYSYDSLNRLTAIPTQGIQYRYDLVGRLREAEDANGIIQHAYDQLGRLLSVIYPNGKTVSYEYDASGNRTRLTYPDSYFVTYNYDALNRVEQILEEGTTLLAQYSYDSLGRRTQLTYGNGVSTDYTYKIDDDLLSLTHTFNGSSVALNYTYNALNKRTGRDVSDDRFLFSPQADDIVNYIPNALNQYTQVQGVILNYDGNGNLSSDGVNTYIYDVENRLVSAATPQHTASYSYDPLGRRITKIIDGDDTVYLYDEDDVIMEYADPGASQYLRRYIYGPYLDEPICLKTSTETYYYSVDGQGSVIALSDDTGNIAEIFSYGPYGEGMPVSSIGNPYFYTGRRYDTEIGLYYYRLRSYDPQLGRFLQVDPIRYLGGALLYAYVGNDPLNWIDPRGIAKRLRRAFKGKGVTAPIWNSLNLLDPLTPLLGKVNLQPYHDHVLLDKPADILTHKGVVETTRNFGWEPEGISIDEDMDEENWRNEYTFIEYVPDEQVLQRLPQITEAGLRYSLLGGLVYEDGKIKWQKSFNCHDFNDMLFAPEEEKEEESAPENQDCCGQ